MINRELIRIKIVQLTYAYYQNGNKNMDNAEKELLFSLSKAYDLYNFLLALIVAITREERHRVDVLSQRAEREGEEAPSQKFAFNKFAVQLEENKMLNAFLEDKKLTWEEIQLYGSDGVMYVTTRMQKTKDIVHNPISEEALELIGYSPDKRGKVFPDFKDSMTQAPLKNWLKDAGITKHISYHCSRHSFACLQLDAGTSIAVVQRYLGHKNVATTEVYAKISDAQKRASVGCITLKK